MNLRLDFGSTSILISHTRSRCCRATSLSGITFTSVTVCASLRMVLQKWMHGPMEKDEVYLHGYLSRFVCDEMDVMFLGTGVSKKQVDC